MKYLITASAALLMAACAFAQPPVPAICIVTVDAGTNFNMIGWDKTAYPASSYNIYKESSPGTYTAIGNVPYGSLSVYFDINSTPDASTSSYKLTAIDAMSNESAQGSAHNTMFLSAAVGVSDEVNLSWTPYAGFTPASYNIWSGASAVTMTLTDNVSGIFTSYVDINQPPGDWCYKVETVNPAGCTPTSPATDYSSSFSNTVCVTIASAGEVHRVENTKVTVFPNPFRDETAFTVQGPFKAIDFELFNVLGKCVQRKQHITLPEFRVTGNGLPRGLYVYRLTNDEGLLLTGKVVVN